MKLDIGHNQSLAFLAVKVQEINYNELHQLKSLLVAKLLYHLKSQPGRQSFSYIF